MKIAGKELSEYAGMLVPVMLPIGWNIIALMAGFVVVFVLLIITLSGGMGGITGSTSTNICMGMAFMLGILLIPLLLNTFELVSIIVSGFLVGLIAVKTYRGRMANAVIAGFFASILYLVVIASIIGVVFVSDHFYNLDVLWLMSPWFPIYLISVLIKGGIWVALQNGNIIDILIGAGLYLLQDMGRGYKPSGDIYQIIAAGIYALATLVLMVVPAIIGAFFAQRFKRKKGENQQGR